MKYRVTIRTEETEPLSQALTQRSADMEDLAAGPHVSVVLASHRPWQEKSVSGTEEKMG